jgi:transcriptional regulator with XRE-family HTH domain
MPKHKEAPHLGHKLAEAIKRKGVTQAAVADHFNVKPPTVSGDWLKRGTIDKKHYPKLVSYFGLPYEWWFGEVDASEAARQTQGSRGEDEELTNDEQRILQIMGRLNDETRSAFVDLFETLIPERRKKNIGHDPDRRLGPNIPPDPHDTKLHEHDWPDEIEQLQERRRK